MLTNLITPHEYPGKLFVVEGIDGSGTITQLALLAKWLSAAGHPIVLTEWNSSALVKAATRADFQPAARHRFRRQSGTFLAENDSRSVGPQE